MTGYRCAACGWEQRPHPTYGWQTHDEHAVAVHKDRLCPNKEQSDG